VKKLTVATMCTAMKLAGGAIAQDAMKKDAMSGGSMAKPMSMQECKDYTAMAKSDAMKKDAKKDSTCADMMKKEGGAMMKNDSMMKSDGMAPKK